MFRAWGKFLFIERSMLDAQSRQKICLHLSLHKFYMLPSSCSAHKSPKRRDRARRQFVFDCESHVRLVGECGDELAA